MKIIRTQDQNGGLCYAALQTDNTARKIKGNLFDQYHITDETIPVEKLLAPVEPTAILCIGANYKLHIEESDKMMPLPQWPIVFCKLPTSIQHPNEPIVLPRHLASDQVDFEGELAIVIGKTCKNASRQNALEYVLGYCCANDVSARDWQKERGGGQWCRGKMFDTFAPLGPCLVTADDIDDPNNLNIKTTLNGQVMQQANTSEMIFDIPTLIEFLSGSTTLAPGTVILTGTPHGVGMARTPPRWLKNGDTISVEIDRIGTLTNPVVEENDF